MLILDYLSLLVLFSSVEWSWGDKGINTQKFPNDFLFGVASSAYQIEGGYSSGGKGQNIWDYYTKHKPEAFHDSSNGDISCDSFNNWQKDIELLEDLGVQFYRFSISWSRVLPEGYSNNINYEGIKYYNDIINMLVSKGIQPMVTMHHFDLPQPMAEIGGWTNPYMAYYFEDYARILYSFYGDRVKYWITLNAACAGYGDDIFPPFINQSGIANYLCSHVMLLAHAKAYHLYDVEYRATQHGSVGLTIDTRWYEPASNNKDDVEAAERAREFYIGILGNPIFHPNGDYPKIVRDRVDEMSREEGYLASRLPSFSPEEVEYVQGTYDFLGLNIYTTFLAKNIPETSSKKASHVKDVRVKLLQKKDWPKSNSEWLRVVPSGLRKVLKWIKDKYDDPDIIITENGFSDAGEIEDTKRIKFYQGYLSSLLEAIYEDGANVKAFAAWSLLDNFEWIAGYSEKFGLYHVDFSDPNRKRTPKHSAKWYKKVIKERRIVEIENVASRLKGDL